MEKINNCKAQIVGIGGRFPRATNADEFWTNLVSGKDCVTADNDRWSASKNVPMRKGTIPNIDCFDASFFHIPRVQADSMDPQMRLLLEVVHETFLDAALRPEEFSAKYKIGVFVGVCRSDAEAIYTDENQDVEAYAISGCAISMLANRISYTFNCKGPSRVISTECSSSLVALHDARVAIETGVCDAAIVASANVLLRPGISQSFLGLNMLSENGQCRSFDDSGNGYVRSEAVVSCLLLGKEVVQVNNRSEFVYATIAGSLSGHGGHLGTGILRPNKQAQIDILKNVYGSCRIDPCEISYIEAHGTGTEVGDNVELNALDTFLFDDGSRKDGLLIGSVKSNVGHCEAASGLVGVLKVCLSYKHGVIPGNLHYDTPRSSIGDLLKKKFTIVSRNTKWLGGVAGVSSFGFGGTCAHVILQGAQKINIPRTANKSDAFPCACVWSARTREASNNLCRFVTGSFCADTANHLSSVASCSVHHHSFRGFAMQRKEGSSVEVRTNAGVTKPKAVWWIFTGMGAHWSYMGVNLLTHPVFYDTVQECEKILEEEITDIGPNALSFILQNSDTKIYQEDMVSATLGLVIIQLGIVRILQYAGADMTYCIGHSVGEIAAAFASDIIDIRQAILLAFHRGSTFSKSNVPNGSMAATGLSWESCVEFIKNNQRFQTEIWPACHNGKYSTTVSGSPEGILEFKKELERKNVYCKIIQTSGIAFHSPLVSPVSKMFKAAISYLFPTHYECKERVCSLKSTSSNITNGSINLAEYFEKNITEPVKFHDALQTVEKGSILIEIGPHTLLRSAISRSITHSKYIGLQKRDCDPLEELYHGIGSLYLAGVNVRYEKIFNVTVFAKRALSGHILSGWDHSVPCTVPSIKRSEETLKLKAVNQKERGANSFCPPKSNDLLSHTQLYFDGWVDRIAEDSLKQSKGIDVSLTYIREHLKLKKGGTDVSSASHTLSKHLLFQCKETDNRSTVYKESLDVFNYVRKDEFGIQPVLCIYIKYKRTFTQWIPVIAMWRAFRDECFTRANVYCIVSNNDQPINKLFQFALLPLNKGRFDFFIDNSFLKTLHLSPFRFSLTRTASLTPYNKALHSCLVIGGTGGIGVHLVRRLITFGARSILLTSRKPIDLTVLHKLTDGRSCKIAAAILDVTKTESISSFFSLHGRSFSCVFYLAGITSDKPVQNMTYTTFSNTVAVKRAAVDLSKELVESNHSPDIIVLCSSVAALGLGHIDYATANGELDAAAIQLQNVVSVRLGPVEVKGSMATEKDILFYKTRGCFPVSIDSVLKVFENILACACARIPLPPVLSLLNINNALWNKFRPWDSSFMLQHTPDHGGKTCKLPFGTNMTLKKRIHPTASIDPSAKIAENVVVGPYTIIGPGVIIESDCSIKPHCVIETGVRIGKACVIGHHVYLGAYTELGVNCILKQNISITGRARLGNHVHIFSGACIGEAGEANSRPVAIGVVTVGNYVTLREGVIIHSPTDTSSTTVGNNTYLMHGVHVAHDCHIGERVTVGPHAVFAGFCDVQYGAFIGLNSTFHQRTTVGAYAMVGMSTRVTRDVPPFCTFVDNVCVKLNSFGLTRLHKIAQRDVDLVMQYFQYGWPDLPRETTWFSHVIRRFFSTRKEKAAGRSLGPIIFGRYDTETNKQSKTKCNGYTLMQSIWAILCKTLHLPASQNIQNDTPFEYLGLDSIVGGRFASSLSNSFKVEISADDIYKHDNLRSLCEYINLKMNGVEVPGNAVSTKEVQLSDNHSNSVEDIKSNVVFQGPIWTTRT